LIVWLYFGELLNSNAFFEIRQKTALTARPILISFSTLGSPSKFKYKIGGNNPTRAAMLCTETQELKW
jgi:hypothetical protein